MPSTTTTSLTLGSIFDLLGPAASTSSVAAAQPGFDSLLQSPSLSAPTPPPEQPLRDSARREDQTQRGPAAADSPANDAHSPPNQTPLNDDQDETPSEKASKSSAPPADAPLAQRNAHPPAGQ